MTEEFDSELRSLTENISTVSVLPVKAEGRISLDLDYDKFAYSLSLDGDMIGDQTSLSGKGTLKFENDRLTLFDFPLPSAGNEEFENALVPEGNFPARNDNEKKGISTRHW